MSAEEPQEPRRSQRALKGGKVTYPREPRTRKTKSVRSANTDASDPKWPEETNIPANTPVNDDIRRLTFALSPTDERDPVDYGPSVEDRHSKNKVVILHMARNNSDRIQIALIEKALGLPEGSFNPRMPIYLLPMRQRRHVPMDATNPPKVILIPNSAALDVVEEYNDLHPKPKMSLDDYFESKEIALIVKIVPISSSFNEPIIRKHAFDGTPLQPNDYQTFNYPFADLEFEVGTAIGGILWDCSLKTAIVTDDEIEAASPGLRHAQTVQITRVRNIVANWQNPEVMLGANWQEDPKYAPYLRGGVYDDGADFKVDLTKYTGDELRQQNIRDKSPGGTVRSKSRHGTSTKATSNKAKSTTSNKETATATTTTKKGTSVTIGSKTAKSRTVRSEGTQRSTRVGTTVGDDISEVDEPVEQPTASGSKAGAKKSSSKKKAAEAEVVGKGKGKAVAVDEDDEEAEGGGENDAGN